MKENLYSSFRTEMDEVISVVLRELPKTFSTESFVEKVKLVIPSQYGNAIKDFGPEVNVKGWISRYYLPWRKSFLRRFKIRFDDGRGLKFNQRWEKK